jgi:hypothetical protein
LPSRDAGQRRAVQGAKRGGTNEGIRGMEAGLAK